MTVRAINYNELIRLAYELAGWDAGPGRPQTVKLRRSISTSYYALFHYLAVSAATLLYGEGPSAEAQRNRVVRWIGHSDVLQLARAVRDPRRPVAGLLLRPAPDLSRIAEAFESLQGVRELADYEHQYDVSRAVALEAADNAADAMDRADRLWIGEDESYLLFLRLMIGGVQIAKRR